VHYDLPAEAAKAAAAAERPKLKGRAPPSIHNIHRPYFDNYGFKPPASHPPRSSSNNGQFRYTPDTPPNQIPYTYHPKIPVGSPSEQPVQHAGAPHQPNLISAPNLDPHELASAQLSGPQRTSRGRPSQNPYNYFKPGPPHQPYAPNPDPHVAEAQLSDLQSTGRRRRPKEIITDYTYPKIPTVGEPNLISAPNPDSHGLALAQLSDLQRTGHRHPGQITDSTYHGIPTVPLHQPNLISASNQPQPNPNQPVHDAGAHQPNLISAPNPPGSSSNTPVSLPSFATLEGSLLNSPSNMLAPLPSFAQLEGPGISSNPPVSLPPQRPPARPRLPGRLPRGSGSAPEFPPP
jgi:hypothetical protein